jgi:hypothetical protein
MTTRPRALILGMILPLAGCATLSTMPMKKWPVVVTSEPRGARVFVSGVDSGVTPLVLSMRARRQPLELRFEKAGYDTVSRFVGRKVRAASLVGNGLAAFLGGASTAFDGGSAAFREAFGQGLVLYLGIDFLTGAVWRMPKDVHVTLPVSGAPPPRPPGDR